MQRQRARLSIPIVLLPLAVVTATVGAVQLLHAVGRLPIFLPAPSEVWSTFWSDPALLLDSMAPTFAKATAGFAISAFLSLLAAALAARFSAAYRPIYNFGVTIQSIPVIATTPLLALWIGTGPPTQIILAALTSQFAMLAAAMQGLRAADVRQRELLFVLNATPFQSFRYLTLPAALSYVFAGFKIAAPAAVLGTIAAEWAGSETGVGALMLNALFSYDPPTVWLSVIAACALAGGGYAFWSIIERLVVTWEIPTELSS